jgi:hypothetical protein
MSMSYPEPGPNGKIDKKAMEEYRRDCQAECDLRTLIEAEKIKLDKERLEYALAKRKAMMTELENIKA